MILLCKIFLPTLIFQIAAGAGKDCWWTGCQPMTWGVRGCSSYQRVEEGKRDCENGHEFNCCLPEPTTEQPIDCWWTGCQPTAWGVRGCQQYDRIELERKSCEGGDEYKCCMGNNSTTPSTVTDEADESCWWTGCQATTWGVRGCQQYDRQEEGRRSCEGGDEFNCCPKKNNIDGEEVCWWTPCLMTNSSSYSCPNGMRLKSDYQCDLGAVMMECCVQRDKNERGDKSLLTGGTFEDLVKSIFMEQNDNAVKPDKLRCDMVDPGKKHMVKIKNEAIRICDLCPKLPQKHLKNVYLDRVASKTQENLRFSECFGLCYEDKKCMALSYDEESSLCYTFDSTAGGFVESDRWTSMLMTQPTGVVRGFSYTRHTRLLGFELKRSHSDSFLHCLDECHNSIHCNFANFNTSSKECTLFANDTDIKYVDLVYGYLSAVKVSYSFLDRPVDERFVIEGDEITLGKGHFIEDPKCSHLRDRNHSASYSQSCIVSGAAVLGCEQSTGCKRCYYPERTEAYEKLPICPDSEFERMKAVKLSLLSNLKMCFEDPTCIGVGYSSETEEITQMNLESFAKQSYNTKYMLKVPPSDDRRYLQNLDLIPKGDIGNIPGGDLQVLPHKTWLECVQALEKSDYQLMSFSHTDNVCKLATERSTFKQVPSIGNIAAFKRSSLTSYELNYLKMPGFAIINAKARETAFCNEKCTEICSLKCSRDFKDWCVYFDIQLMDKGASCSFYDDEGDFGILANERSTVFSLISPLDFSLESFDKLSSFQPSDVYDCFDDENDLTLTSLSNNKLQTTEVSLRRKRGIGDFFKNLGKGIVDGFKKVGRAIADTAKGAVKTVGNLIKGDLKAAKESFLKIPVVDLAKNTGELAGAVFTGDWNKAKNKGKEILESDAFELVTTVAVPGAGKIITSGAKAAVKGLTQAGKQGAKTVVKGGKTKIDDTAKGGRNIKNGEKNGKKQNENPKKKKEEEKIDRERGEKCDNHKRSRRATSKGKQKPGNCKNNKQVKCARPKNVKNVIGVTLDDCANKNVGAICRYECKPGYKEEPAKATCKNVKGNGVWEPFPKCVLVPCSNQDTQMIVYETPQSPILGMSGLGDYIVAYVSLFDRKRKLPVWSVALHQSFQFESKNYNANKDFKRVNFTPYPCPQLKPHQTTNADYHGRGKEWQKGHLTPFNPIRWSEKARRITNVYTNQAPQDAHTNEGVWETLESHIYCFSKRYRTIVATGICSSDLKDKIGSNVHVPSCFWKMACYRDESSNTQVVGFYSSNSHVNTQSEKEARTNEVLTPLSQKELRSKIGGSFNEVWVRPARHVNTGRPVPIGQNDGVWMPVNILACRDAGDLSNEEKKAWSDSFDKTKNEIKRGSNVGNVDFNSVNPPPSSLGKRKRDRRASGLQRGCRPDEMKSALDAVGAFLPKNDYSNEESDDDESGSKDEGDGSVKVGVQSCGKRIVGYYTSWGDKTIAGRELQRLTHAIYAFLEVHSDGRISVGSADRKNAEDIEKETRKARQRLEGLMESAQRYPHVKVLFAVGGWENSQYFSAIAASPALRVTFISSIVRMIEEFGFDGVDIDWEYPVTGGANEGVPSDKSNYVILMKDVRTALDGLASRVGRKEKFLLSFAGAAGQWTLDPGYDLPELLKYADFANIMTYDYFGAWASKWGAYTGPPSPLYFGMPPGFSGKTNADWSVKYYTCKSKMPHKINMGVPFYGRYWKNVGGSVDGKDEMWRKAEAVGGKFEGGYVPWNKIKTDYLNKGTFQKKYHEKAQAPYAWNPAEKIFLGYEDEKSLQEKVKYAVEKNVGGLMIWALELDDDDLTLLDVIAKAPLCQKSDPSDINHKCSPIDDKRWWTPEDGEDKAGLCGRSAPLYKGFYPVCDPDDPGYSCCGDAGYCGSGPKYCDCPTCKNYREDPKTILTEPIKPSIPVTWYLLNDPDGKRGRCGRKIPKINGVFPTCNPDDENTYCCSNGGYCGNSEAHCQCNGCVDFKKDPKYQFGPKKWWTLEDGEDLGGQCGKKAPKVDGIYEPECEGSSNFHCCSDTGWCGSGPSFCDCAGCKNFKGKN